MAKPSKENISEETSGYIEPNHNFMASRNRESDVIQVAVMHNKLVDDSGYEDVKHSYYCPILEQEFEGLIAPMQFICATLVCAI